MLPVVTPLWHTLYCNSINAYCFPLQLKLMRTVCACTIGQKMYGQEPPWNSRGMIYYVASIHHNIIHQASVIHQALHCILCLIICLCFFFAFFISEPDHGDVGFVL